MLKDRMGQTAFAVAMNAKDNEAASAILSREPSTAEEVCNVPFTASFQLFYLQSSFMSNTILIRERSIGTAEFHYSTKKQEHSMSIICLKNITAFSCYNNIDMFSLQIFIQLFVFDAVTIDSARFILPVDKLYLFNSLFF